MYHAERLILVVGQLCISCWKERENVYLEWENSLINPFYKIAKDYAK